MNKYEFKIEDIKEVKIITKEDPHCYTIHYERINRNLFKESYHSLPIEIANDRKVGIMCNSCGKITKFKKRYYHSNNFIFRCSKCNNHPVTCDENYLREYILSLMTKEAFSGIDLYINNIHIV